MKKIVVTLSLFMAACTSVSSMIWAEDTISDAIENTQPEVLTDIFKHNIRLSTHDQHRYLTKAQNTVQKKESALQPRFVKSEKIQAAIGAGVAGFGLYILSVVLEDLERGFGLNERTIVATTAGGLLAGGGLYELYKAFTKQKRKLDYYKALAIEGLIRRAPLAH